MPKRHSERVQAQYRRLAVWCIVGALLLLILSLAWLGSTAAAPFRPLDADRTYYGPQATDPPIIVEFPPYPTAITCENGHVLGSAADCPMYVAVPTVVSQSGLVGVPSVAVGSLPGADGLLLLLNAIALFGVSLLVIMGFLYVLVVRRGGQ